MANEDRRRRPERAERPRPATRTSRDRTRTALLDAAERLWAERGIQGASLEEVATAAGLTKGAVYSNFTGKADLLLALLERQTRDVPARFSWNHTVDTTAESKADDAERPRMLTLLLVELWLYGMRDYSAGWRIAEWYHAIRDELAREFAERDDLAGVSPEERAAMVVAMDLGLALQHLLDPVRVPSATRAAGLRLIL